MAVYSLTISDLGPGNTKPVVLINPSWADVEAAIRKLDNDRFNDIHFQRDEDFEDFWLSVGGGAGRYLITGSSPDGFPTVVDHRRADLPDELLCVGGQDGNYPAKWIQPLETALIAAKSFFETGEFSGPVEWEMA